MASSVDMELGDMMYEHCLMALFFVEGANLLVPFRENFNFKRIVARFSSFFKGFIGAGGWGLKAQKPLGTVKIHTRAVVLNDRKIWLFTGTYLQKRLREIISLRKYIDHSRVSADLFVI